MVYANLVLPLPLKGLFTYVVPQEYHATIAVGSRVIVQFGKKKFYTAIVYQLQDSECDKNGTNLSLPSSLKEISAVLDDYPIVSSLQLQFWEWLASYYMCSLGDVYKAALPAALKLESETSVMSNPDFEASTPLSNKEILVLSILSPHKALKIAEIEKRTALTNSIPTIKSLVDKQAAYISEDIRKQYTAKTQAVVCLARAFTSEELINLLDLLGRAKQQQHLLSIFLSLKEQATLVFKKQLLNQANASAPLLNELVRKGILQIQQHAIHRISYADSTIQAAHTLNEYQQKAYKEIKKSFEEKEVTLLYGVTSSGKTEIYIHLIQEAIAQGKQVLYLLPEIALTTQITERLKAVFGNQLAVYHSRFSDNERAEVWSKLLQDANCKVILGARSALFLPFNRLGLIIIDEEHESSYKQQDPAPRYNARNAALVLASMCKAKVLLGSATPAVETYYNAIQGRYGLVQLTKRYEDIELPEILAIDTKELRRTKQMKSILSPPLIEHIDEALANRQQIILFQNRRGFASLLECKTCAWTMCCTHCDVSLTYHKGQGLMVCHYCAASHRVPTQCPDCKTPSIETKGYGTEQIEEEVNSLFPQGATVRMDWDTTRSKRAYEHILSNFEQNKTNILIGTQMVSKGLDFDNVRVVGILNADSLLNYPDFRAHERAFQLMTQVSGRAGRKNKRGLVLLQTAQPQHPIVLYVKNNDYQSFFQLQIDERRLFRYPPFCRLISIVLRAKEEAVADAAANLFGQLLKESFGERVLGPTRPPVARIQSLHIRHILLKIENQAAMQDVRDALEHHQHTLLAYTAFKSILLHYDVDPM